MVRIITCWCLARYTQWVLVPPGSEPPQQQQQQQQQQQAPQIAPENEVCVCVCVCACMHLVCCLWWCWWV
jgi:hypothetical protein